MGFTITDVVLPISIVPSTRMDDDALLEFCAQNDMLRVERTREGTLRVMSPSGGETSALNAEIIFQLTGWARTTGGGVVFDSNAGFSLPDGSMMSPDAAWISTDRWQSLSSAARERFAPICPEFLIELRSPSDRVSELECKMQMWMVNGARLAWLVDPQRRSVTVYGTGAEPRSFSAPASVTGEGPVARFTLNCSFLWAR